MKNKKSQKKVNNKAKINKMNNANSGSDQFSADITGDNESFGVPTGISAEVYRSCPEIVEEMVNTYGTYNIQPTANSANDYPAIAQGETKNMKERPLEFFRGEEDFNPASDISDRDCT